MRRQHVVQVVGDALTVQGLECQEILRIGCGHVLTIVLQVHAFLLGTCLRRLIHAWQPSLRRTTWQQRHDSLTCSLLGQFELPETLDEVQNSETHPISGAAWLRMGHEVCARFAQRGMTPELVQTVVSWQRFQRLGSDMNVARLCS